MTRRRWKQPRALLLWSVLFGVGAVGIISTTGSAAIPTSVDAYNGSAFAAGIHSSAGTNAFPNFAGGAVDNRYPLTMVGMDGSPATDARASVNDYGPLGATLITTDCSKPPAPLPNPNPSAPPNYCLAGVRDLAPYAHAQYPHPPGKPDDEAPQPPTGANKAAIGDSTTHAEELKADAFGHYTGVGNEATAPVVQNATAESHTIIKPDGTVDVTTHSHVARASFAAGVIVIGDVDVITEVKSIGGKVTDLATVSPGTVTVAGHLVQVDDKGITIDSTSFPATGGVSTASPAYQIRTVQPQKRVNGNHGTVLAEGLEVTVINQGVPSRGIESTSITYVLGEGGADGFGTPSQLIPQLSSNAGDVQGAVADTFGSSSFPGYTGSAPSTLVTRTKSLPGKTRRLVAASALAQLPLPWLFFVWEGVVFAAAATMVYNRRRRLAEELE